MNARLAILIGLLLGSAPVFAHHSFSAEYDAKKPIMLAGTVTRVEWLNPHTKFYVDVKGEDGKVVNWEFELGSPNQLARRGWTRHSLNIGDKITVDAYLAKDGSHLADVRTATLADGRKVFAGSAGDGGPNK
jgi:Family of unknown function (DUF6152)